MNLDVFGNVLSENIAQLLDTASGVNLVVIAALDQLFKIVCLALQINIYLIMFAIIIYAQQLHIWLILDSVYAKNASLDALFALHHIFVVIASLDTAYIKDGVIYSVLETQIRY